jgi:hypothetical protein
MLRNYESDPRYIAFSLYVVVFNALVNFIVMNIIIGLSCEYFQVFVPMQRTVIKTLQYSAHREYKSIVILLTQIGIQIPFLHARYPHSQNVGPNRNIR